MPRAKRYIFTDRHSFEDYLIKFYSQKRDNLYLDYTKDVDAIFLKLENIQKELRKLFGQTGIEIKSIKIPHLSKSHLKREHYASYYTERSRQIVKNCFKNELKHFDYTF